MTTPILHCEPNSPEGHYTRVHVRTRKVIERTFGVLKCRFLLAHRTPHYTPRKAAQIENACHNIINDASFEADREAIDLESARQPPCVAAIRDEPMTDRHHIVERLWRNRHYVIDL